MNLTGLKPLYTSMKSNNIKRTKFKVVINNAVFEIIYFIDSIPHSLAIGVRDRNLFFEVPVLKDFVINSYLGPHYKTIYEILGLTPTGTSPFTPDKFFNEINNKIPTSTNAKNTPKARDIAPYRPDVEEPKKIYFLGWKDNDLKNEKVSKENLEKTKLWLGEEAYQMCKHHNISSCWTSEQSKEKVYTSPSKKRAFLLEGFSGT